MSDGRVPITWAADLLARNGVQWPYASKDVADEEMLREMWKYILESHWRKEHEGGVEDAGGR